MTDSEPGPFGSDTPALGLNEMEVMESSVRRNISSNWSLASSVWELADESHGKHNTITFHHRDSISRIRISSTGGCVDMDVTVEVFRPLSKADARQGPAEDINDLTVTVKTFDLMGEAVWFAEYFARSADDRIPDDPATNLTGPVDGERED